VWRIYYSDGSTFSAGDGPPDQAPGWGVVVIPQDADGWWGHDLAGLLDCLAQSGPNVVVHGRTVDSRDWPRFLKAADADPDLPPGEGRTIMHSWDHYCWHGERR
jgi:hypothetical protein